MQRSAYPHFPVFDYLYVYTRKTAGLAKARLAFRGDQRRRWQEKVGIVSAKDAPTMEKESGRFFQAVNAEKGWLGWNGDIPTAFL